MGNAIIDSTTIGTFDPQTVGTSSTAYIDSTVIGSGGPYTATGTVYLDSVAVGTYTALSAYTITGITRDANGTPLGNCTVWLFRTSDKAFIAETTSDASGNYSFSVSDNTTQYFVRAFKDGTPNVFGTTDKNLVGS